MAHLFGGVLRSQVKCGSCGAESNTLDPFLDLSLELLGCTSVAAALRKFSAAESLAGANAYKCEKCKRCAPLLAPLNSRRRLTCVASFVEWQTPSPAHFASFWLSAGICMVSGSSRPV